MKSVIAGEYTAPPAQGPMITLIWGTTPDAIMFRLEHICVSSQAGDPFLDARAPRIVQSDDRSAILHGHVHDLANFFVHGVSLREPPKTVKSWLNT